MLQMMLVDNLIHSDLHPGNILVSLEAPRGPFNLLKRALRLLEPLGLSLPPRLLQPHLVLLDVGPPLSRSPLPPYRLPLPPPHLEGSVPALESFTRWSAAARVCPSANVTPCGTLILLLSSHRSSADSQGPLF